jgi:hypothetical protein
MSYVGEKRAPCYPFVLIDKPLRPYRPKLSEAQQKTEDARRANGKETCELPRMAFRTAFCFAGACFVCASAVIALLSVGAASAARIAALF